MEQYTQLKAAVPADRLKIAMDLLTSNEISKTGQPWFVRDITFACMENLAPVDRQEFRDTLHAHPIVKEFDAFYPRAAFWYKDREDILLSSGQDGVNDPLRSEWQAARRTALSCFADIKAQGVSEDVQNAVKVSQLNRLADLPVLEKIAKDAPWSALDVYSALVDSYPEEGRKAFADRIMLHSEAYKTVQEECPELADFYKRKVGALSAQVVVSADIKPKLS